MLTIIAGSLKTLEINTIRKVEKGALAPIAHNPNLEHLTLMSRNCDLEELTSCQSGKIYTSLRSLYLQL